MIFVTKEVRENDELKLQTSEKDEIIESTV